MGESKQEQRYGFKQRDTLLLVDFHRSLVPEGRLAQQKLVQEDAERPPVYGRVVAFRLDDLGGEVLWRAAQGVGFFCRDGE